MRNPKIGLLPMYVKLYDISTPQMRPRINAFHALIAERLAASGLDVKNTDVCRTEDEFDKAVRFFENEDVDAIVTLHLAYSPSLESAQVLCGTKLPLIVLDTTQDFVFDDQTPAEAMLYNHGIHGVQDMCCMLRRGGKKFEVCAGHYEHSDVLERVVKSAKAAAIAHDLHTSRVGIIGTPFDGMGDFRIPFDELKSSLGIEVVTASDEDIAKTKATVTDADLEAEYRADLSEYEFVNVSETLYKDVSKVALAVRRWIENENLDAFTMNFLEAQPGRAFCYMPFAEASKAMGRGIGYAGEGDVMTAALVSALLKAYPETTFTEMFCPDWKNNTIFMSHMGEYNINVSKGKACMKEKDFPYTPAENPTVLLDTLKPGPVVYVNLAPRANGKYALILTEGEMIDVPRDNNQNYVVNGWFRPNGDLAHFLEDFSNAGGTHHSAIIYNGDIEVIKKFGLYCDFDVIVIQ